MTGFDAKEVFEACIFGVEGLPFVLGFGAVDFERAVGFAVAGVLGVGCELEERGG